MKGILFCVLLAQALAVHAAECGLTSGYVPFQVTGASADAPDIGPPEVEVLDITRGLGSGTKCDRQGLLVLRVEAPRGFDLAELGLEFKVVSPGAPAFDLFPAQPLAAEARRKRKAEFVFTWLDEAVQTPLRVEVELRAVTRDGRRGQPVRFYVDQSRTSG